MLCDFFFEKSINENPDSLFIQNNPPTEKFLLYFNEDYKLMKKFVEYKRD